MSSRIRFSAFTQRGQEQDLSLKGTGTKTKNKGEPGCYMPRGGGVENNNIQWDAGLERVQG